MTYTLDIFNTKGKKVETVDLDTAVFNDENINESLIHEFFLLQRANARHPIAHTKTRAEINRSGKKLYKQKGTGNARVGDASSPIRRKGWVAFGPRNDRDYTKTMNKKARRLALSGLLTLKAKSSSLVGLDMFKFDEIKTKNAIEVLKNIGINTTKTLVVIPTKDDVLTKSFRNIQNVKYLLADYVNPYDLLNSDKIMFVGDALQKVVAILK